MTALACQMPNPELEPARFVDLLEDSQTAVALHVLAAWDGETTDGINAHLAEARGVLHEIVIAAGTVGCAEVRAKAQLCVAQITAHLEGPYADLAICPGEILWCADTFVEACASVVPEQGIRPS